MTAQESNAKARSASRPNISTATNGGEHEKSGPASMLIFPADFPLWEEIASMKRQRFSVEQIVAGIEAGRAGLACRGSEPPGWDIRADLLPMEKAACRVDQVHELTAGGSKRTRS